MINHYTPVVNSSNPTIKRSITLMPTRTSRQLSNSSRTHLGTGTATLLTMINGIKLLIRNPSGPVTGMITCSTMTIYLHGTLRHITSITSTITKRNNLSTNLGTVAHSLARTLINRT